MCRLEGVVGMQVQIFELLQKFNGERITDDVAAGRRRFRVQRLPPYLAMSVRRFTKNRFFVEKNPTIVNFPVKNLDMRCCLPPPTENGEDDAARTAADGDAEMADAAVEEEPAGKGAGTEGGATKEKKKLLLQEKKKKTETKKEAKKDKGAKAEKPASTLYNLVASVSHIGSQRPDGVYKAYVHRAAEGAWYEVQDLILKETVPEAVVISEAYLQVYERQPRR